MLEKHYDHKSIEENWYQRWEASGVFSGSPDDTREPFTILIPPPNVTGILHMGHVLNNTIQDTLIRYKKMRGYNACWIPGTDHAGIATQNMVEKHLRKQGLDPDTMSREAFLEKVWEWKEQYGGVIIQQLRKLGASCDWDREFFTMDDTRSDAVLHVFKQLYDKGLIYRGDYIVNWCPALMTALSDDEVERSEEPSNLWHFCYPIAGEDGHLVVATTRPETMLGDTGVAVHPNDERYQHLIGKKIKLPIVDREIPIFGDEHVDPTFGTGCVKVTPAHSQDDFEMGKTHNLQFIVIMDKRARMNQNVPEAFQGLDRYAARKKVVATMDTLGLLAKIDDHKVAVGRCYRTNDVIEPYLSKQWFIRMEPLAKPALAAVADGQITLYPERWVNTYNYWLENIRDWCISRQLRWGHRIPVYYCHACGEESCVIETPTHCPACGSDRIEQDPDVLDTWASSWILPFSAHGWPQKTADLAYYYPSQTLVTAADIIFFWVARMIMSGIEFMGEVPFSKVVFNGIVRDMDGRKMSKTLGNSPDPLDVIDQFGADAMRFTIVYNTPYGMDARFSEDACSLGRGFCTKIWNANRFLQMTFEGIEPDPNWADKPQDIVGRWILSRMTDTVAAMTDDMENFRFAAAASRIYNFFWGEFCDWYVELLKPAVREADDAEKARLLGRTIHVVDTCLRLLHPLMPFVTEELWHGLGDRPETIFMVQQQWPEPQEAWRDETADNSLAMLQELITGIRAVRKSYNLPHSAKLKLHLFASDHQRAMVDEVETMLCKLASVDSVAFLNEDNTPDGCTAVAVTGLSAYLDLRGHLDVDAEIAKIDQKVTKLTKESKGLAGRLNNANFVDRAPADVVEKARADYDELTRQIETLSQTRTDLERLQ